MKRKHFKYSLLTILAILPGIPLIEYGDGCSGMHSVIFTTFLTLLFLLIWTLLILFQAHGYLFKKKKFDVNLWFLLLPLFISFGLSINFGSRKSRYKIFKEVSVPNKEGDPQYNLVLYENGYFDLEKTFIEATCRYLGEYEINGDTLILKREAISQISDGFIQNKYIMSQDRNAFFPIDCGIVLKNEKYMPEKAQINLTLKKIYWSPYPISNLGKDSIHFQIEFVYDISTESYEEIIIDWNPGGKDFLESDLIFNEDSLATYSALYWVKGLHHHKTYLEGYKFEHQKCWGKRRICIVSSYKIHKDSLESLKQKIRNFLDAGYYNFNSDKFTTSFSKDDVKVFEVTEK